MGADLLLLLRLVAFVRELAARGGPELAAQCGLEPDDLLHQGNFNFSLELLELRDGG
ncbi:MAG: hypothetical protein ABFS46_18150 [Myxococcota bacterium]